MLNNNQKNPTGKPEPVGVKFEADKGVKLPGKYDDKGWTKLFKKGFKVKMTCPKCGYSVDKKVKYSANPLIFLLCITIIFMWVPIMIYGIQKGNQQMAVKMMQNQGTLHLKGKDAAVCPKCKDALMEYTILEVSDWQ